VDCATTRSYLRAGDTADVVACFWNTAAFYARETENGKLNADAPPAQLYDLEADLSQTTNLYHTHPEIVQQMKALLQKSITDPRTAPIQN